MQIEINVPDGKLGDWEIDTFTISEHQAKEYNFGVIMYGTPEARIKEGTYKRLIHKEIGTVMSNTPMEVRDHRKFFHKAEELGGDILINGLGLGMSLTKILEYPNVNSVTVIEMSEEVIKMVAPHFKDDRVVVIQHDALTYMPPKGKRFSCVWHDIWPSKDSDNLPEMGTLHRKYGRRCDWQGSWGREWIKRDLRKNY